MFHLQAKHLALDRGSMPARDARGLPLSVHRQPPPRPSLCRPPRRSRDNVRIPTKMSFGWLTCWQFRAPVCPSLSELPQSIGSQVTAHFPASSRLLHRQDRQFSEPQRAYTLTKDNGPHSPEHGRMGTSTLAGPRQTDNAEHALTVGDGSPWAKLSWVDTTPGGGTTRPREARRCLASVCNHKVSLFMAAC